MPHGATLTVLMAAMASSGPIELSRYLGSKVQQLWLECWNMRMVIYFGGNIFPSLFWVGVFQNIFNHTVIPISIYLNYSNLIVGIFVTIRMAGHSAVMG